MTVAAADAAARKPRRSSPVGHLLLTSAIVVSAAVVLRLVDTDYADYVNSWRFVGRVGLHNPVVPIVATLAYLAMLVWLPSLMTKRAPLELQPVMLVHNYLLSTFSLVCAIGIGREIFAKSMQPNAVVEVLCDPGQKHDQSPLYFWYFLFYLSKMYEFLDTTILILRKKPTIFLHKYHHVITLWLCWAMLDDRMSVQWICTIANLIVHVFMYYFYACQSLSLDVWWKRYLTLLQILQFIADEVGNASWAYFVVYAGVQCSGSWPGFWFGMGVIASFLVLFIFFYQASYSSKKPKANGAAPKPNGVHTSNGVHKVNGTNGVHLNGAAAALVDKEE